MAQKIIFLDIDGTLTEPGKNTPPPSAVKAIQKARQRGHRVVLCSGRNYGLLSPLLPFGFDGFICSAGGYIEYESQVIYDCPMTGEQRERVFSALDESGIYYIMESRDHSYTDESFKIFLNKSIQNHANSELLRWQRQMESDRDTLPMARYQGEPIYKAVFMSPGMEHLKKPIEYLKEEFYFCIQDEDRKDRRIINGDLINKAFHKGTALKRLCQYLNVSHTDTIAFGDSMNDLEMLQAAALGICMENGSPALKALADQICPPLFEDGIYRAFQKLKLI